MILCTVFSNEVTEKSAEEKALAEKLPRVPAVEPVDALATFKLARGFRLELVAAEPMVADPVDACFDENGRMYVAEMHGYPYSFEPTKLYPSGGGKKDAGVIRLLEDTNGDGRMDRSIAFADKISWPTSVCCSRGGLFVATVSGPGFTDSGLQYGTTYAYGIMTVDDAGNRSVEAIINATTNAATVAEQSLGGSGAVDLLFLIGLAPLLRRRSVRST